VEGQTGFNEANEWKGRGTYGKKGRNTPNTQTILIKYAPCFPEGGKKKKRQREEDKRSQKKERGKNRNRSQKNHEEKR